MMEEVLSPGGKMKKSVSTMTLPIEGAPSLAVPHDNPEKRPNPFDLHWRTEGSRWVGNLKGAWTGKYAHLEGEVYCKYCGAVPCSLDHDELKATRTKDLDFVRDIVKDKKDLQQKYDKLLEELKLAEKRKLEWDFERRLMDAELSRLKSINDKQLNKLADFRKEQQKILPDTLTKIETLNRQVKALEEENTKLSAEVQKVRQLLVSQMDETERVKRDNKRLIVELEDAENHIRVLKVQLDEANEEKRSAQAQLASGESRMKEVEDEIRKILAELHVKTRAFEDKDNLSRALIQELRDQVLDHKARLDESERYQADLQDQIDAYLQEIEKLRLKLASDKRFKMFVEVKRECNDLKERNEVLLHQRNGHLGHAHSIPFLSANGRVMSPVSRQGSPALRLRRAKSASVFTSRERLYSYRKVKDALQLENI